MSEKSLSLLNSKVPKSKEIRIHQLKKSHNQKSQNDIEYPYKLSSNNYKGFRSSRTHKTNNSQNVEGAFMKLVKNYEKDLKVVRKSLETYSFI
mmetsp:Transcript_16701/g.14615  ORF Transcript_16701/g.14615 Transcript_16701/m.14615 type:complete len:93 (-) Transcript_16701:663-941(-)